MSQFVANSCPAPAFAAIAADGTLMRECLEDPLLSKYQVGWGCGWGGCWVERPLCGVGFIAALQRSRALLTSLGRLPAKLAACDLLCRRAQAAEHAIEP
jgi:hypothetical protein